MLGIKAQHPEVQQSSWDHEEDCAKEDEIKGQKKPGTLGHTQAAAQTLDCLPVLWGGKKKSFLDHSLSSYLLLSTRLIPNIINMEHL